MYHIVICDDEPIFLTQISEMISDILASMGESCEIRKYTSIAELKNTLQNTPKNCDILILDIMLGENNGISFAAVSYTHLNLGNSLTKRDFRLQSGNLVYKMRFSFTKRDSWVTNGTLALHFTVILFFLFFIARS